MGKSEEGQPTPPAPESARAPAEGNACDGCSRCRSIGRIARPRCAVTLIVSLAMLLSAVFWLPPFLRRYEGSGLPDRGPWFTADVIAGFRLQKPVDFLNSNIEKLQVDVYEEIGVPDSSIAVINMDRLGQSNWTNVIFGVWPYPKNSNFSSTGLSILRSSFMSLVIGQSTLHLTTSLFGNSSSFDVLKFPGGITVIPMQRVFTLQNEQMFFNFTLNFSIHRVQDKLNELKDQMKAGLLLNANENLYVRLTNLEGTTIAPPTIVQTSIVLAVGNRRPSLPRWKELAHTIRNSSAGNLGLNHTVFGKVKQIRLSSFLSHSSSNGSNTASPSPAPQPKPEHHLHRLHHHHHHHKHHYPPQFAPAPAPAPNTAAEYGHRTSAPSGCPHGHSSKSKSNGHLSPAAAPVNALKHSAAPTPIADHSDNRPVSAPPSAPQNLWAPRVPASLPVPVASLIPPSPAERAVSFTHVPPPVPSVKANRVRRTMPLMLSSPSSSVSDESFFHLVLVPFLYALLHL